MSERIVIEFSTENAAFDAPNYEAEVARILHLLADRAAYSCRGDYIPIKDNNGNKIGEFRSIIKE